MQRKLFSYIWAHSAKAQLGLLGLSLVGLPFYYVSLELPKLIINRALGEARPTATFLDRAMFELDALTLLVVLCLTFLAAVTVSGGCKFALNVYKSRVAERLLRGLRSELCAQALRFPMKHARTLSTDEMVPMVTSELDNVGGFAAEAVALPAMQGGLLLTGLLFIFVQDLWMGLAAVVLFPFQGVVTPLLQRQVNRLTRQRIHAVRRLAAAFGQTLDGLAHVRASGTSPLMLSRLDRRLEDIQRLRYALVVRKSFIKVLNNFLFQLTPFFFLLFGGILVLRTELTLGALVAILAAYKDLPPPARELLDYFQNQQDAQLKYEQVVAQFTPPDLVPETILQDLHSPATQPLPGTLETHDLAAHDARGKDLLEGLNLRVEAGERVAITGLGSDAGETLTWILARLLEPDAGQIHVGGQPLESLTEPVLRATVQLVEREPSFFGGTLADNLLDEEHEGGANGTVMNALETLGIGSDLLRLGLDAHLDEQHAVLVLAARRLAAERLGDGGEGLVEALDPARINRGASIGENIVWGALMDRSASLEALYHNQTLLRAIGAAGLNQTLCEIGERLVDQAPLAVSGESKITSKASTREILHPEELPPAKHSLRRKRLLGFDRVTRAERALLISFALRLKPDALDLTPALETKILEARRYFAHGQPERFKAQCIPFEPNAYNRALSLWDNIVFGRMIDSDPHLKERVDSIVIEIVEQSGLSAVARNAALHVDLGHLPVRLDEDVRQRLGLVRTLLGKQSLVVVDRATSELDLDIARRLIRTCLEHDPAKTWVWVLGRHALEREFDRVIRITTRLDQ